MPAKPIRVAIVEDQELMAAGLGVTKAALNSPLYDALQTQRRSRRKTLTVLIGSGGRNDFVGLSHSVHVANGLAHRRQAH